MIAKVGKLLALREGACCSSEDKGGQIGVGLPEQQPAVAWLECEQSLEGAHHCERC